MTDKEGQARDPLKPIVRCNCGMLFGLGLHHVYPDGRVTASFFHLYLNGANAPKSGPGCGWHEFIELEGYDGPEFPPTA